MKQVVSTAKRIEGTPVPPGDKSISHRAALLNSIASGTATVSHFCEGDDRRAMLRCLKGLGVNIKRIASPDGDPSSDRFVVQGHGPYGLHEPDDVLDAGNSATTMRLVAGLLAAQPFMSVISGDSSLRSRPMDRITRPLIAMGATIMGRGQDTLAPLSIRGGDLKAIEYKLPVASAQLKSCLLIAGLHAKGETIIHEPGASRDHTERMMRAMGADVTIKRRTVTVRHSALSPMDVYVPGDISGAAFWLVLGACHPNASIRIRRVGMNPTRAGVVEILKAMGAKIKVENIHEDAGEPSADLVIESSQLEATEISGEIIPRVIDELPILALAACFAKGTTRIKDARELRVKESDRIDATVEGLSALGANIQERTDGMVIVGGNPLTGTEVNSYGDHRIAMTMAIAGLIAKGETTIHGAEAAGASYPRFWDTLDSLLPTGQK
ncbi:MAG: 3-phosphoshikimate 1-carboxyvinyltransferase [Chloroflexi bacterium]|nr:3-phosphoshikimate 1-carboxyvinyltransferase [Chloroflexota bacterium]